MTSYILPSLLRQPPSFFIRRGPFVAPRRYLKSLTSPSAFVCRENCGVGKKKPQTMTGTLVTRLLQTCKTHYVPSTPFAAPPPPTLLCWSRYRTPLRKKNKNSEKKAHSDTGMILKVPATCGFLGDGHIPTSNSSYIILFWGGE